MKTTELKILVAGVLLCMTASAQALQPEVIYGFQLEPEYPSGSLVQGSDGNFYGTTAEGGRSDAGTVFQMTTNGMWTTLVSFTRTNGAHPFAGLVLGNDGNFYGTTAYGGSSDAGTVFQMTINGVLTSLVSFTRTNGANPYAGLVLGRDGNFYGTTEQGGSSYIDQNLRPGYGTIFKVTTNGVLTSLVSFTGTNGAGPYAAMVMGNDGNFYGTTALGGSSYVDPNQPGYGTVFKVTTNGGVTTLVSFAGADGNGANPYAGLLLGRDGHFYGTTEQGGSSGYGTVFRVTATGLLTLLVSFNGANGDLPQTGLVLGSDGDLYGTTGFGGSGASDPYTGSGTVFKVTTNGVLTTLVEFTGTNGAYPRTALVMGSDGNFYGTTGVGGGGGGGTVFKVTTSGVLTTLVSFAYTVGPAGLVQGSDGNFYGTTAYGGASGYGTVFQVTTNGTLTSLAWFSVTNGAYPRTGLVLGRDGNFYGTTTGGGSSGQGTAFKVTTNGVLTSLVSFTGTNGVYPQAALVTGDDGNFYGTTALGGSSYVDPSQPGYGTVFKVTTNGVLTTLASFANADGAYPQAALVLGNDGTFYGTTWQDREHGGSGTVFKVTTNGVLTSLLPFCCDVYPKSGLVLGSDGHFYGTTSGGRNSSGYGAVFRVTANGVLTTLVSFNGTNGSNPQAALVLGSDGCFYGTTARTEYFGDGTVFKVTTNGVLTSLVSFTGANGANPRAGLVLGRDGYFYGTTSSGGPGGGGTIFRLVISAFTGVARQPGGSVLLSGTGPFNGSYRLWASTDLSLPFPSWTLLTSAFFDSNGNFTYTDVGAVTNPSRFYQLSVP